MLLVNGSDLSQIACNIKYTDSFNNGASSLTFEYPAAKAGLFPNGSAVVFTYGGANVFYGFLFTSKANDATVKCTACDQLRYLKAEAFLTRQEEPLDSFCNKVFAQAGDRIRVGAMDSTQISLKKCIFDNKTWLDMIYDSIRENLYFNGYLYALRDEFGALTLRDVYDLRLPLVIGDGSLATGYDYSISIDGDTANYVKVGHDNDAAGVRDVFVAEDSANIAKWGKLALYKTVSGSVNEAQLKELAANILAVKNRETESLTLDCTGDLRVRAGCGVKVVLSAAGINLWAMVTKAAHSFAGASHTMRLELQYGRWQSWMS